MSFGKDGAKYLLFGCFILVFAVLICLNSIGLGLVLVAAAVLVPCKFNIRHFLPALFTVSLMFNIAAIFAFQPPVISDFKEMLAAARQAANGDFSFQNTAYFFRWAYQTGFVLWEAAILRLTGSVTCIKIVNALLLSGADCLIYCLVRRCTSEKCAQAAALLYLAMPFPALMCCILTNQQSSAFFFLLALYIFPDGVKRDFSICRLVLSGLCFFMGNLLRPEVIAVFAGLLGTAVFILIAQGSLKQFAKMAVSIAVSAAVCFGCMAAASALVSELGVNRYGLNNNWTEWKFVVGFNPITEGGYSADDENLFGGAHYPDSQESEAERASEQERQEIARRVFTTPGKFIKLELRKAQKLWMDDGLYFPLGYLNEDDTSFLSLTGSQWYVFFFTARQDCVHKCAAVFRNRRGIGFGTKGREIEL